MGNIFAFIQKQSAFLADSLFYNQSTDSVTEVKIRLLKNSCLCFKVGVALLVGILFALNIGLELLFDAICEKCEDMFGAKKNSQSGKSSGTCGHIQTLQIINCPSIFFYTNTSSSKTLHVANIFKYISS